MTPEELGRRSAAEIASGIPAKYDAPEQTVSAILSKQDEIINKMNAILVAIETATDAASLFTALDTASIKANLAKVKLSL